MVGRFMGRHAPRHAALQHPCALLLAVTVLASGCASTLCPTASALEAQRWQAALERAAPLELEPSASLAIKRDLHELVVDTDALTLARSFHAVMRDGKRRFGLIRVDRLPENVGKPFVLGERFQGRYELSAAARQALPAQLRHLFGPLLAEPGVEKLLCNIENGHTSDYGEIVRLELETPNFGKYTMEYRYLSGSPIAGSSTFEVMDVTERNELAALGVTQAARVRQIFVYQEQSTSFAKFFTSGGLKLHNQVLYSQVTQAAEAAGARVIRSDIPREYTAERAKPADPSIRARSREHEIEHVARGGTGQ